MSSVPYADLGEASENRSGSPTRDHSDDDEINEKGDIGVTRVSDNVYASYQVFIIFDNFTSSCLYSR